MRLASLKRYSARYGSRLERSVAGLSRTTKSTALLIIDIALVPFSLIVIGLIWSGGTIFPHNNMASLLTVMAIAAGISSVLLGLPRIKLNTYEQTGIQRTAAYAAITGFVGITFSQLAPGQNASFTFLMMVAMALIIFSVSVRLIMRSVLILIYRSGQKRQRVLIYGAGQTGVQLATALGTDETVEAVAFIDDNPTLRSVVVAGLPVYSPVQIKKIVRENSIDRIVLAMPSNSQPKQARLARHLEDTGCEVSMLPSFASLVNEGELMDRIQPVNPSTYLGRDGVDEDLQDVCDIYHNSTIMITGAGGSIGGELTRQILRCHPGKIVLFEISEHALYQLDRELRDIASDRVDCEIVPVLGSVTDEKQVLRTLRTHKVDTILHAAAYKHVTMVEKNPLPSLHNNVVGTRIVARAARECGVGDFILVSTDKAVHPKNVMGASKRFAEMIIQDAASRSVTTRFGIVRFGNVLGSSGSVVPLFEEQINRGGPITLSHEEVTRYFMTITEAACLVLRVSSLVNKQNERGEVFVLDMGKPVQIKELARQMITDAGYTVCNANNPNGDIEITITGLLPGEKLHEELTMRGNSIVATDHPKILRVEEACLSEIEIATALRALDEALDNGDQQAARDVLTRWVGADSSIAKYGEFSDQPLLTS